MTLQKLYRDLSVIGSHTRLEPFRTVLSTSTQNRQKKKKFRICNFSSHPEHFLYEGRALGKSSGVPRNFFRGGGVQQIQLRTEDREQGSGGGSPLVRVSGGSCNLVQEI
jgi:hypothetical protein